MSFNVAFRFLFLFLTDPDTPSAISSIRREGMPVICGLHDPTIFCFELFVILTLLLWTSSIEVYGCTPIYPPITLHHPYLSHRVPRAFPIDFTSVFCGISVRSAVDSDSFTNLSLSLTRNCTPIASFSLAMCSLFTVRCVCLVFFFLFILSFILFQRYVFISEILRLFYSHFLVIIVCMPTCMCTYIASSRKIAACLLVLVQSCVRSICPISRCLYILWPTLIRLCL